MNSDFINPFLYPKNVHNAITAIIIISIMKAILISPFYKLIISILSLYITPARELPNTICVIS